ncbi:MAG TPA: mannose-6-phosphate isomerase [Bacteroidales bacterium]|nr:mannose-6-phosphate isomerase [Bacteroidales bacterium]
MGNALYPLKFKPILKERIWGGAKLRDKMGKQFPDSKEKYGESWEVSGVEGDVSVVQNGFLAGNTLNELIEVYMGDLVGESLYERFGEEFPLLIKLIDASETLSIQVHPSDEIARERHHAYGKTEMWYIIDADRDALIYTGFEKDITREEYIQAVKDGNLERYLHQEQAIAGDVFFIPAGRVHAIGKGVLLAEIQQTSDITYRIFDWNRVDGSGKSRELHTELAVDAIDFSKVHNPKTHPEYEVNRTSELSACKYFTVNRITFTSAMQRDYNMLDSFVIYLCLEGEGSVVYASGASERLTKGETVLLPADLKDVILRPQGKCSLLEVYVNPT